MSDKNKDLLLFSITLNILFVVSLLIIICCNNKQRDNYNKCNCSGLQTKLCTDNNKVQNLYKEGKLTEYNFPQCKIGSPLTKSSRYCNN